MAGLVKRVDGAQVKVAERNRKLADLVAEACSQEAHDDASTHSRQLRPLHVLDKRKALKRVRCNPELSFCRASRPASSVSGGIVVIHVITCS